MATIQSNIARLHASLPALRSQPAAGVTPVTQRLEFPSPKPALRTASMFSLPKEPEDARLTGGTRSLDRRLLALNLNKPYAKSRPVRAVPAPQRMAAPIRPTAA
ncbi:MAG TPA: hypothetical protein VG714_07575 [Acidobacteriaceae bacterium]|nr:hypothetical protein [Acidobacteriaceae bacterium]